MTKQIIFHLHQINKRRPKPRKKQNFFVPSKQLLLQFNHLTHSELGKKLNLSSTKVKNLRKRYNIPNYINGRWKTDKTEKIELVYNKNKLVWFLDSSSSVKEVLNLPDFKQLESFSGFVYLNRVPNNWK